MPLKRGILIVFEGIDGSGKTTQAKSLLDKLRMKGIDAVYFQEPTQGKWGRIIKEKALLPDSLTPQEEVDLFQKDRKQNVEKNLKPSLKERKVVILDRYYFSTIAYQGAKGIDPGWIRRINEKFAVKPDIIFILDIEAKNGLQRIEDRKKKDRLFEREEYLVKVREMFRGFKGKDFIHIDGAKPKEKISQEIEKIVFDYLKKRITS